MLAELEVPVHRVKARILDRLDEDDLRELARLTDRMRDAAREVEDERSRDAAREVEDERSREAADA